MKKKKTLSRASRVAPVFQSVLIAAVTYVLLVFLLLLGIAPEQHDIQVGLPAPLDILATKDVNDTVTTDKLRDEAAARVEATYKSVDTSVAPEVMSDLQAHFSALAQLRRDMTVDGVIALSDAELDNLNARQGLALTREQYVALIEADPDMLDQLFEDASRQVRDLMNNSLLQGQESTAVSNIARTLSTNGYTPPLVGICSEVMRASVKANMLIDAEATEANRQKAREEVETVTRVKGEVIVRRGEIVTSAQYQMLSSLGLLKEESLDIPLFAGIALIVLLVMACLALYLLRFQRELLNPKPLSLICLIFLLVVTLSLTISQWNTYLMPVALGMMLMSLLIGQRSALYLNVALGLIISLLADASSGVFTVAMFSVAMMSMVSGPVILSVFSRSMQRTTTLLAGVLVGISNFLVTLGVGLINSAELSAVLTNALYATAGGLLSAVLCIGFQPLMEWLFNLATNARLIELSNPNQPVLRRLLIEAPGTYHHSIIVANLAEAAASAVGGNGLLARVGAYYHDIGKLKRPVYFKENQMGDNPHDRTDPRVSAAILTAHPRDGAAMAVKARIPEPVIDIIRQHHGDGVALWFYDKAVKLYGADQVDISAFRYDGPRPRSKEAAVVMLADTIEAAVRSIPDPDTEKVDAVIRKLVRGKLDDGQLDESELTFSDLEKICSAFSTVLTGVFHERIEYPDVTLPPRTEEAAKGGKATHAAKPAAKPAGDKPVDTKPVTKPAEDKHAEAPAAMDVHADGGAASDGKSTAADTAGKAAAKPAEPAAAPAHPAGISGDAGNNATGAKPEAVSDGGTAIPANAVAEPGTKAAPEPKPEGPRHATQASASAEVQPQQAPREALANGH